VGIDGVGNGEEFGREWEWELEVLGCPGKARVLELCCLWFLAVVDFVYLSLHCSMLSWSTSFSKLYASLTLFHFFGFQQF
jgi:hypothetical protein